VNRSDAKVRLAAQIYEARYALRFIYHSGACRASLGNEKQCGKLVRAHGFCDRWKQQNRVARLEEVLRELKKAEKCLREMP
jgi:hypothetical protein